MRVGDVLARCSATVLKAGKEQQYERDGYGKRPYDNFERVVFDCRVRGVVGEGSPPPQGARAGKGRQGGAGSL